MFKDSWTSQLSWVGQLRVERQRERQREKDAEERVIAK